MKKNVFMKIAVVLVLLLGVFCIKHLITYMANYNSCNAVSSDADGFSYSSLKVMSALFYEYDDSLYLIGGTEAAIGVHNSANNSIFVYNVSNNDLVLYEKLSNSISVTSFCEDGNNIYFGTIDKNNSYGADVYCWDKIKLELAQCTHIDNVKGVYDIGSCVQNGNSNIVITSSDPLGVWIFDKENGKLTKCDVDLPDSKFIRSCSVVDDKIYLGMGCNAGLIEYDITTGDTAPILPCEYDDQTFVYDQYTLDNKIYMLLSPSYDVLKYDVEDKSFSLVSRFDNENRNDLLNLDSTMEKVYLLGNIFFLDKESGTIQGSVQGGSDASYIYKNTLYGVDSSGILRKYNGSGLLSEIDLYEFVDKEYTVPQKYVVYNDAIYIPGRRFVKSSLNSAEKTVFLVSDEPQALYVDENGVFTANYTECTLYYYPWNVFNSHSYSVNMNDEEYLLADIDEQCRPYDICRSDKYVFLASGPMYGKFGGALSVYDFEKKKLLYTDINIIKDQIISALCISGEEGNIWLASDTHGENTTPDKVDEKPHVVLYDYVERVINRDIELAEDDIGISKVIEYGEYLYILNHYGNLYIYNLTEGEFCYSNREQQWRGLNLINDSLIVNDGNKVSSIDVNGTEEVIIDGFDNLTGITQDMVTKKIYGFDNANLVELKIEG